MTQNLALNKTHAIAFYQMAYQGEPRKAVELYVGDDYIQHNPLVGDGKEPFITYFDRMAIPCISLRSTLVELPSA